MKAKPHIVRLPRTGDYTKFKVSVAGNSRIVSVKARWGKSEIQLLSSELTCADLRL